MKRICLYSYRTTRGQNAGLKAWHPVSISCVHLSNRSATVLTIDARDVTVNPEDADPGTFSLSTIKRGETPLDRP